LSKASLRIGFAFGLSAYLLKDHMRNFKFFTPLKLNDTNDVVSECCGIVGYIGNQRKAGEVCI
jgi:hypothetical protein